MSDTDGTIIPPGDATALALVDMPTSLAGTADGLREILLAQFSQAQVDFLLQRTPHEVIRQRKGRGKDKQGNEIWFSYVDIAYVISRLNLVFGFNWSFTVKDRWHDTEADECIVEGQLLVRTQKGDVLLKEQYGGADVKRWTYGDKVGKPLSMADDFKAAASDALKKCATLLGLGLDLSEGSSQEGIATPPEAAQGRSASPKGNKPVTPEDYDGRINAIYTAGRAAGMIDEEIEAQVAKLTSRKQFSECNDSQQKAIVNYFLGLKPKGR